MAVEHKRARALRLAFSPQFRTQRVMKQQHEAEALHLSSIGIRKTALWMPRKAMRRRPQGDQAPYSVPSTKTTPV